MKNVWLMSAAVFVNFLAYASVPPVDIEKAQEEAAHILLSFRGAPSLIAEKRRFDDEEIRHVKIAKSELEGAKQKRLITKTFGTIEKVTKNAAPVRVFGWECCFKEIKRSQKLRHNMHIRISPFGTDGFQLDSCCRADTLARLKSAWNNCKDGCKCIAFEEYKNSFAETFYIDIEAWKIDQKKWKIHEDNVIRESEAVLKK